MAVLKLMILAKCRVLNIIQTVLYQTSLNRGIFSENADDQLQSALHG